VLHANLFRSVEASGLFAADPELQAGSSDMEALANHYTLLVKVCRIIGAAIVSRGSHNIAQGRRFLTEHRMLVLHVLKRSAGIGAGSGKMEAVLEEKIQDLAEAFMVLITATGFLEVRADSVSTLSAAPLRTATSHMQPRKTS
jgi:nuclear pore complex protein Nup205